MAITFDPDNKVIQLDVFTVSVKELWTAMVDWSVLDDNLKYGVGMVQLGGVVPIALYIYLSNGWKVRPVEADGVTTITGNLLTDDNSHPVIATQGNWQTLVNMETPVKAIGISSNATSGLSDSQVNLLSDVRDALLNIQTPAVIDLTSSSVPIPTAQPVQSVGSIITPKLPSVSGVPQETLGTITFE